MARPLPRVPPPAESRTTGLPTWRGGVFAGLLVACTVFPMVVQPGG